MMTKVAKLKPDAPASERALLEELLRQVVAMRAEIAELRRGPSAGALVAALEAEFGSASFTAAGLFLIVDEEPDSGITKAITALVDMSAPPRARATQLGILLSKLPQLEAHGSYRGGALYRLRRT